MNTSCIGHPRREPLIIIRKWQVEYCDDNTCAAALLSYFEHWHNIKLAHQGQAAKENATAKRNGVVPTQNDSLIQFHTSAELEQGILIYKRHTIRKAISFLEMLGVITVFDHNPNPKYTFDKTKHFLFHPDVVNKWLDENRKQEEVAKVADRSATNGVPSATNGGTIPKTPSKIHPKEEEVTPPTSPKEKLTAKANEFIDRWNRFANGTGRVTEMMLADPPTDIENETRVLLHKRLGIGNFSTSFDDIFTELAACTWIAEWKPSLLQFLGKNKDGVYKTTILLAGGYRDRGYGGNGHGQPPKPRANVTPELQREFEDACRRCDESGQAMEGRTVTAWEFKGFDVPAEYISQTHMRLKKEEAKRNATTDADNAP